MSVNALVPASPLLVSPGLAWSRLDGLGQPGLDAEPAAWVL